MEKEKKKQELPGELTEETALPEESESEDGETEEDKAELERLRQDKAEFEKEFPDVDLLALERNAAFRRFCGSRLYKESVADLYRDYLALTGELRRSAETRRERSTGSGSGQSSGGLTPAEQRALEEWNRTYPGMKMTAREFKSRG